MTSLQPITDESVKSGSEVAREEPLLPTPIDRILQKLSRIELPAKDHLEHYMRHKWRLNHKPRTLQSSFTSVMLFLDFCEKSGKRDLGEEAEWAAYPPLEKNLTISFLKESLTPRSSEALVNRRPLNVAAGPIFPKENAGKIYARSASRRTGTENRDFPHY